MSRNLAFPALQRLLNYLLSAVQGSVQPDIYLQNYTSAFDNVKQQFNMTAIGQVFNATDHLVIASTPSLTPDISVQQLENATYQFELELSSFGVNLTQLQAHQV